MRRSAFLLLLIFYLSAGINASDDVYGIIESMGGEVKLSRKGKFIPREEINTGMKVYPYDIIQTGREGFTKLLMIPPAGGKIEIEGMDSSIFFLEHEELKQEQLTGINLIIGTIQIAVKEHPPKKRFTVRSEEFSIRAETENAVFSVHRTPDSSILIICKEGSVYYENNRKNQRIQDNSIYEIDARGHVTGLSLAPDEISNYTYY